LKLHEILEFDISIWITHFCPAEISEISFWLFVACFDLSIAHRFIFIFYLFKLIPYLLVNPTIKIKFRFFKWRLEIWLYAWNFERSGETRPQIFFFPVIKFGTTHAPRCWIPVFGDHTIGPKIMENGDNYSTRRGGTWEGVPVEPWCSEWICRMRGGLVHHTIMIPTALSLPLLRGACSRSCHDNISKRLILYQNLQIFQPPIFSIARPVARGNQNFSLLPKYEIGTTNTLQCPVPIWTDHTIGPKTAKNGDNYSTAPKRNMGRSASGKLVQWVNL